MRRLFWLAILILLLMPHESRSDSALKALMTANDSRGWDAVGRIEFGGHSFCTGALIAEDLVLTAAHCLFGDDGAPYAADEIRFLAGWRNGRAAAYRGVRQAVTHPDFETGTDSRRIAHDLALLRLDQPVRLTSVTPFAVEARPRKGDPVGVVSYAHDRPDSPSLQELCHVLARQSGVLVLSCDVDFGSSGAPVFTLEGGVPHIVSVISAKADSDGRKVALGTELTGPLEDLKAMLAAEEPGLAAGLVQATPPVRRIGADGGRTGSGAKFLRP